MMDYSSFAASKLSRFTLENCSLRFSAVIKCTQRGLEVSSCVFEKTQFQQTALKGVDFTDSRLGSIVISDNFSELRGAIFTAAQAAQLALLMGIKIK